MSPERAFGHIPVMRDEVVELFGAVPAGVVLDGTVGGAGHARALLDTHPHLSVVGLDHDPDAVAAAGEALASYGGRATVRRGSFAHAGLALDRLRVGSLSGVLLDLGVSSWQLDQFDRGFSYRGDGPLDMRMDPDQPLSATDVVNTWSPERLARLIADNGEPRFARRITRAIVAARPVTTTAQLAEVVRAAIPAAARRSGRHPARRVFQAVRVAVNAELDLLPGAVDDLVERLAPGGRIVVISYHSGEDRIVKDRLRSAATGGCRCPPGLPCVCGASPTVRLLRRGAAVPGAAELAGNRRAESARLRAAERLAGAAAGAGAAAEAQGEQP